MTMPVAIDEQLLRRLPLPLAQLYRRAHNSRTAIERHQAAYYLWEAGLKLLGSVALVDFAGRHSPAPELAERLQSLARPSMGHWWEFARRLVPILADGGDVGFIGVRDLLLGRARDDLPRAAGLDAVLCEHFDGRGGARSTVRLAELFERLVRYRNQVAAGHGAAGLKETAFYERMGRALLAGVAEVLGRLDVLAGRRLVYIAEVRRQASRRWIVERFELIGETAHRLESLDMEETAALPDAECLHLELTAALEQRSLQPLVVYDADGGEVSFLNSRRGRRGIEYLCYTSGRVHEREDCAAGQSDLLGRLLKLPVEPAQLAQWQERSQAEERATEPAEAVAHVARRLGEFELISELGRGGMGVVFRAWQPSLGRQVALKSMSATGDPKAEARFAREIRALGRVEHPHLVKIFTSGSDGDRWFYAMELLEGATLAAVCDKLAARSTTPGTLDLPTWRETVASVCSEAKLAEKPLSDVSADALPPRPAGSLATSSVPPRAGSRDYVRQTVELVRQIAEAAHALHEGGVIHRDIKPGNILVNETGSQAVLMDLGLAQLADQVQGRLTRTRQFVGTLRYASPEQVLAVGSLDRRSDIYSLGATLWELLTLRPMFGATEQTPTPELMQRIQYEEPERLRRYHPGRIGRDLEAVVHKCLEKDPKKRYATAAELVEELSRVLDGQPLVARPVSGLERGWRWALRKPAIACSLLALAAIALVASFAIYHFWQVAEQKRKTADDTTEQLIELRKILQGLNDDQRETLRQFSEFVRKNPQLAHKNFAEAMAIFNAEARPTTALPELTVQQFAAFQAETVATANPNMLGD
jgi:serine/threonine protein kinase